MRYSFAVAAALCVTGLAAHADTYQYSYVGATFSSVSGGYTTNDYVSGFFDFNAPLAANLNSATVTPSNFSFSDGVQTIDLSDDVYGDEQFEISTDTSGSITGYNIFVDGSNASTLRFISASGSDVGTPNALGNEEAVVELSSTLPEGKGDAFTNGTLALSVLPSSTTPEPSSFLLLGTGMLGVAGALRKRFAWALSGRESTMRRTDEISLKNL